MMAIPTDRGHVILTQDAAGATTVMVGTSLLDGEVQNVYAQHVGAGEVRVHPGVRLADGHDGRYSLDVVEVYVGGDNVVNIRQLEAGADLRSAR
jgi:hypothetical protein